MNTETEKRGPGRPPKEEQKRRRKKDSGGVAGSRLAVNLSLLDFNRFAYRWLNDSPARIQAKTKEDDWDIVRSNGQPVKDDSADMGDAVSQVVGAKPDGSPLLAYLCRKPRAYFDEDQKEKSEELDKQLEQLRRGNDRAGGSQSDYVPSSGIRLG